MEPIWIIAKREVQSYFDSLMAYILLIAFLGFSGFFTWMYGADIFLQGQASLESFFGIAKLTLFFFIPAITMRLLAEEKKTGTIELLLTKAVSDRQVVVGKFLSCIILIAIALAFTLPYYITVASIGPIDHGATICGYFGLLLLSGAYISIGLFASSITNNQIVAFLIALFISAFFYVIFEVLAFSFTGNLAYFFNYLSLSEHFSSMARGVIDTKDLIYFISIIFFGLILSEIVIAKRKIAD